MPETSLPTHARTVIIGAGIAGCSVAFHLTKLGWRDIVVVDQGPLFETGGSTSPRPRRCVPNQRVENDDQFRSIHR